MALTRIQMRRDTTANWIAANPVLSDGEFGIEDLSSGARTFKIGDGSTAWTSLSYPSALTKAAIIATGVLASDIGGISGVSPALTGTPTAPTATAGTSTTQVATTAFATGGIATETTRATTAEALKAPLASPTFTGVPAAPTATAGTSTTQLATTAFTATAVAAETTRATNAESVKAPLASPGLTGAPTATTAAALDNSTRISTTAYADAATLVEKTRALAAEALLAPLASPTLTGSPAAPTQTGGDSSTKLATTAFVATAITPLAPKASPTFTGVPAAPTASALTATTQLATTAYADAAVGVETTRATTAEALKAPLASPALTGAPTATTATALDNSTRISTTAYADAATAVEKARALAAEAAVMVPNILLANDASFEADISGWQSSVNCAVVQSSAAAKVGTQCLALTSTASGAMSAALKTGNRVTVSAGQTYTAIASFQTAVTAQPARVSIVWYNSSGSTVGTQQNSATVTDTHGAWATASVTAVAPAGAIYAGIVVGTTGTTAGSEVHWVDCVGLQAGSGTAWQDGLRKRTINIDDFGADPTGVNDSGFAWTQAYAAATDALKTWSGAIIEFGQGTYKFAIGELIVNHALIGVKGQGEGITIIEITGNTGDGMFVTNTTLLTSQAAAPIQGFTLYGWNAGNNVNGLHYSDRYRSRLDVEIVGFQGTGSRNLLVKNDQNTSSGCEGTVANVHLSAGGVSCVTFDGFSLNGTFDYSNWWFHCVEGAPSQNHSLVEIINGGHIIGGRLSIVGNISQGTGTVVNVLKIGASTSDTATISAELQVAVEVDGGNCNDLNVSAGSFAGGLQNCWGSFSTFNAGGTTVAGPFAGSYQAQMAGLLSSPTFTTNGQLTQIGPAFATWDFSNTQKALIRTDQGCFQPGTTASGPGARIWSGSGAPTTPGGAITYNLGDAYFRTGTPSTANQRLYLVTTAGTSPVWTGVL